MSYVFTVNSASMQPIGYRATHNPQLPAVPERLGAPRGVPARGPHAPPDATPLQGRVPEAPAQGLVDWCEHVEIPPAAVGLRPPLAHGDGAGHEAHVPPLERGQLVRAHPCEKGGFEVRPVVGPHTKP